MRTFQALLDVSFMSALFDRSNSWPSEKENDLIATDLSTMFPDLNEGCAGDAAALVTDEAQSMSDNTGTAKLSHKTSDR